MILYRINTEHIAHVTAVAAECLVNRRNHPALRVDTLYILGRGQSRIDHFLLLQLKRIGIYVGHIHICIHYAAGMPEIAQINEFSAARMQTYLLAQLTVSRLQARLTGNDGSAGVLPHAAEALVVMAARDEDPAVGSHRPYAHDQMISAARYGFVSIPGPGLTGYILISVIQIP